MIVRFSPLLATGARTMVPTLAMFSLYLLVVGHDVPGGGFAGGLVASIGLLLMYLAYGERGLRRALPIDSLMVIGSGLLLAVAGGLVGIIDGGAFLTYTFATSDLPLVGEVKVSTLLLFDLGVYVLVIGVAATALQRLGGDPQ
ncbi:MAG: Na(+)/H(+) antiporter subunit B [Acidimicrobiia bacterium]|nr:Na(+)/H(+) antiporter subunit B [Acidimicrobiia bacterium]